MKKTFRISNSPTKSADFFFICQNLEVAAINQQLGDIAAVEHS